jgi:hypothetical protein
MRRVAQLDADCRIEPCRAAAEASDLHANAAFRVALRMASAANYFKLKSSMLKLFPQWHGGATGGFAGTAAVYYGFGE